MLKRSDDGSSGGVRHRTVNFEYKKIGVSGGRPGRPGHNIEIATATNGGAHTPALKTLTPNISRVDAVWVECYNLLLSSNDLVSEILIPSAAGPVNTRDTTVAHPWFHGRAHDPTR